MGLLTGARGRSRTVAFAVTLAALLLAVSASSALARSAFVSNFGLGSVSVFDTQTNQVAGSTIAVGTKPQGMAITPDGRFAYVANAGSGTVSVIDTQAGQTVGSPIAVGVFPYAVAITPDGRYAYVVNNGSESVSVIDTQTKQVVKTITTVDPNPIGIAITPDGRHAYVADNGSGNVSVIDTQTNQTVGSPIGVGTHPSGVAITPDQPPLASFGVSLARPGVPVAFSAVGSSDPDGTIAGYGWTFGDGKSASVQGQTLHHAYKKPGDYKVTLTLTDDEGCSTAFVFTGQTASCNGSPAATQTQAVKVAYPGVRVRCPGSAGRHGCRYRLQAVTKRRKGKAESATAKAEVDARGTKIVSLKTKKRYAAKLASAKQILVEEKLTIRGSTRTRFARLKVVR